MSYTKKRVSNTPGKVFIAGGDGNTMSGMCSSILGGRGNTVTHDFAAVFGNGIASVAPKTFHVERLNAVNTPVAFVGVPAGTVMWKNIGAILPTDRVLVVA